MVKMQKDNMYVNMFGHFQMSGMGGSMEEDSIRSDMLTKLLVYITYHHKKEITIQELVDVLWQDEESDNPAGALKNLVYRLRTLLRKNWEGKEFILTGRSSYKWNPEIFIETDADRFENFCAKASGETDAASKIECYKQALILYKGMFLPKLSGEYWVASLATYYHSMYISAVKSASVLLETEARYEEMEQICRNALQMDNLDESLHCNFIRALLCQKKIKLAAEHYRKASDILYDNLGVTPSKDLQEVYQEILKQINVEAESVLDVQEDLDTDEEPGAFLCEYGVFKKTYQLEKRRAHRLGISVHLLLITVSPTLDLKEDSKAYMNIINSGMKRLEDILQKKLRAGDVISKFSPTQYIVLLPTCQYESAKIVVKRIEDAYQSYPGKKLRVKLQYSLGAMDYAPSNEDMGRGF